MISRPDRCMRVWALATLLSLSPGLRGNAAEPAVSASARRGPAIDQVSPPGNWPEFRGPNGNGQGESQNPPLKWSETENIVWKTPIHDHGWSSPVVWQDQVWVTTATEDGRRLYAVCVDRTDGSILHDVRVFDVDAPEPVAAVNSYASPTAAIESGRVYVHYGTYGTA